MNELIEYAIKYKKLYQQKPESIFHVACGCVVAQQVKFSVGRTIRKDLYELCGYPLKRKIVKKADLSSIKNLTEKRIKLILEMCNIDDTQDDEIIINEYAKLPGFGEWTVGAVSILLNVSDTINLSSDAYIRANLVSYTGKLMTKTECHKYIMKAEDDQTIVCYFLWRIKKESVYKIKSNEKLSIGDFI